ncbi:MAG: hypothetical protein JW795_13430, partial [Chitinivibrionales bacterium]|nr:hypothetical protein [Chitinivibrionales bacterium]
KGSVNIVVLPGDPDHLVIEPSGEKPSGDFLWKDNPLESVTLEPNDDFNENFYAILRDQDSNWIRPAQPVSWSTENSSIISALEGSQPQLGQGRARRVERIKDSDGDVTKQMGRYLFNGKQLGDDIEVRVRYIKPAKYVLTFNASVLDVTKRHAIDADMLSIPGVEEMLKNVAPDNDGKYSGIMFMTVEPDDVSLLTENDSFEAVVTLFDGLGNIVLDRKSMIYDSRPQFKRLLYLWDGTNNMQRRVGSGTYLAMVRITYKYKDTADHDVVQRKLVGVNAKR